MSERSAILVEIGVLWLVTLLAIRIVVIVAPSFPLLGEPVLMVLVPVLFMYAPVWSCQLRGADPWAYPMALPPWPWEDSTEWATGLRWGFGLSALVLVPFVAGYHVWQTMLAPELEVALGVTLYPGTPAFTGRLPSAWWLLEVIGTQLFFVAIPEEMFYRGYVQTRLDEAWAPRWRVLGTLVGPGLLATCVIFALGHTVVIYQWWHVFIIVPSLAFGWLRARTGSIVAGSVFHMWCNVTVQTLDSLYGLGG